MDFENNKHNIISYLPANSDKNIWKMSISGVGFQSIKPQEVYPPKGHPIGYTFNPNRGRIIDEFTLVYLVKGEGKFMSIHCPEEKITKGDIFFLFPGQWHTYEPNKETGWDEYFIAFQGEYFNNLLLQTLNQEHPIYHIGINENIVKLIHEMIDCARAQQAGFQAMLTGIMMHIIGEIYSISKRQDIGSASMQKMQEVCILMRENIFNKFTAEEIAESINMSYSNFRKSFKQYSGIAPHQYILQLKLNKIKELLGNTDMSIQEIASKMNFESADYFSYFFRNKTGVAPLSYRKEIEKQRDKAHRNIH